MSCRKFKTVSILILSFIFLFNAFVFVFASDFYGRDESIESGDYYIISYDDELYLNNLNGHSVLLGIGNAGSQQGWEIISDSNGYYYIKNIYTGKYLTAPNNYLEDSIIEQNALSPSLGDRQLWSFVIPYEGAETFYIQAKSHESTELILKCIETTNQGEYVLVQSTQRYDYYTEWMLEQAERVHLVGIDFSSSGLNHTNPINTANYVFVSDNYITTAINTTNISALTLKTYLINSDVFILRSIGGYDNIGTYMYIDYENPLNYLHAWDIYNYNGNNGINMSDCEVAVFAGCYTANHQTHSLPKAAVDAGAKCSIGFSDNPSMTNLNLWTTSFSSGYISHKDPVRAANDAIRAAGDSYELNSIAIIEQGG